MRALVVGAGQMGRWLCGVLRSTAEPDVELAVADTDATVAEGAAAEFGATVTRNPGEADPDLVCIAVPISAASGAIATWGPVASSAIVDVTGVAAEPIEAMRDHAPDAERASFHPLFAPSNEPGNVAVVVDADGPTVRTVRDAFAARGNDLYETTAADHDEAMSTVQSRTHAAVLAYGLAAEPVPDELHTPISAGLADLLDQVTGGDPRVYAEIQAAFDGAEDVAEAARDIAAADPDAFERLYADAGDR
jgi:prephenate dehydrogenase